MNYPHYRKELLAMLEADQQEVRACSKAYWQAPSAAATRDIRERFIVHSKDRVSRALEILDDIGLPTIENIGTDGAQALSVLALHANLSTMRRVLSTFEKGYSENSASVYYEAIPSLTDRILIIEGKNQRFGTQWMLGADGKFFLPPVEGFDQMNRRRAAYGLGKSRHPIDLTNGVPKTDPPRPDTQASDQRLPTKPEYQGFVYGSLD